MNNSHDAGGCIKTESRVSGSLSAETRNRQIRRVLESAGFSRQRLLELLRVGEFATVEERRRLPFYVTRAREPSSISTLIKLFYLRQSIAADEFQSIIGSNQLDDWADVGLVKFDGSEVIGLVELSPYENLVVAADWADEDEADAYQVMGIAASSRTLAQATIRRHARVTLDLGTGSGILALLASAHSDRVLAVDSNPRALAMAQLNANLNGICNITFLEGNLFEPVCSECFDLIVCNPPFVIAPEQIYLHSHSAMPADRFCENLVRTAPEFLADGGYFQMVCNWVQPAGENWQSRLESWFDGSGCDAWILYSHSEAAAEYAINRISKLPLSAEQRQARFDSWVSYYESENIEAIGFGLITMHRSRKKSNWFRCDSWPEMIGACGDAMEAGFAARDFLETRDDHELLEARVRRAPNLHWRRKHDFADLNTAVHSALQLTSGLAYSADVDSAIAHFVNRCAGDRPLSDHLKEAAQLHGEDPARFAPRFLTVVRALMLRGFLKPV